VSDTRGQCVSATTLPYRARPPSTGRGRIVGRDDAYAQALYCFEIIAAALEEAGASLDDIVRTRVYLTRIDDWQAAGRAHREVFTNTRPASTMLEVSRLIGDGMLVEVEADAILGGRDKK